MESEVIKTTTKPEDRAKELIAECHALIDGIRPVGGNLALLRSLKKMLQQAVDYQCGTKKKSIKIKNVCKK